MTFRQRVLSRVARRLGDPAPPLRIVFWDNEAFSFLPAPSVTITLRSRRIGCRLLAGNIDGLADAYVGGDLFVDGRLQDILHVGVSIAERLGRSGLVRAMAKLLRRRPRRHARRQDVAAIAHHYDVSNDFYALWLDDRMISRAENCRTFPACCTKWRARDWRWWMSRTCARIIRRRCCTGSGGWKPSASGPSKRPANGATGSGACTWPGWRTRSIAAC